MKRFKFVQDKFGNFRKEKLDTMVKFDRKIKLQKLFSQAQGILNTAEDTLTEKYLIQGVVHH